MFRCFASRFSSDWIWATVGIDSRLLFALAGLVSFGSAPSYTVWDIGSETHHEVLLITTAGSPLSPYNSTRSCPSFDTQMWPLPPLRRGSVGPWTSEAL